MQRNLPRERAMSSLRDMARNDPDAVEQRKTMFRGFGWSVSDDAPAVSVSAEEIIAAAEPDPVAAVETADVRLPYNAVTHNEYRGGNIIRLLIVEAERGYGSGGWAGYNQWLEIGRCVRKGQNAANGCGGTMIAAMGSKKDDQGNVTTFPGKPRRVFHFDQTDPIETEETS